MVQLRYMPKSNRDWRIELLRFLSTIGIAVFHFEWIDLGQPIYFRHFYLFVEFFFVLSGFFLALNVRKYQGSDKYSALRYLGNDVKKLWPPYILAFIFSFIIYCNVNSINSISSVLQLLWQSKWEMVFLHLSGFDLVAPVINGVTAYIPALLAAELIVFYLLQYHYVFTVNIVAVFVPVFVYSHIVNLYGNVSQWGIYENWYTVGILRGLAGVLIGVFFHEIGELLKNHRGNFIRLVLFFLCGFAVLGLVIFRNRISYYDEMIYPYIFAIMISSIYYCKTKVSIPFLERISLLGGKISYEIFLIHYGVCYLLKNFLYEIEYIESLTLYLIGLFAILCVFHYVFLAILKIRQKIYGH